jgi:glycosyltransferase involved in cell wall biosynthesis
MKTKRKIIFVLPSLESVSPIRSAFSIAKGFIDTHEVTFVSINSDIDKGGTIRDDLRVLNIECIFLDCNGLKNIFLAKYKLQNIVDKIDPDIILSYLLRPDLIVSVVRCRAVKISSVRNMIDRLYRQSHGMLAGIFFGFLHKSALSRFDKLIVMSGDMKKFFLENSFDENKLVLIHNSLDEEDVELKKKDEINFPFNDNLPVIISTSSLTKVKNVSLLIKTSIELLDKGLKFNILIIGDGDQRGELINIVNASKYNNNFYFSGHLSNPIPYLIRSDIFIMTSISEGVSRSLMEALYLGKMCIVSNIDGNRELIENGVNGYLFSNKSELKHLIEINIATQKASIDSFLLSDFSYLKSLEAHKTLFNSLH